MDPIDKFGSYDSDGHCVVMAIVIARNVLSTDLGKHGFILSIYLLTRCSCDSINIMAAPKADLISPFYTHLQNLLSLMQGLMFNSQAVSSSIALDTKTLGHLFIFS
jgi:hypothetical protein